MKKIFYLLTISLLTTFISCEDYNPAVEAPVSLGFEKASEQVSYVTEDNVKSIRVYATHTSDVDRVVAVNQLDGLDPQDNPYTTAEEGDFTVSSTSVTIPAGELYGTFEIEFNPDLDLTVTRYVTFEIDYPEDYSVNNTKKTVKVTYNRLCFSNTIIYELTLDRWSSETTWDIRNSSDEVVESGGPYGPDAAANVLQPLNPMSFTLPDGNYTFTIYDAYGDGMVTSASVIGSYKISKDCGSVLVDQIGDCEFSRSHTFTLP